MFHFLCLFGPGVLTWLVSNKFLDGQKEDEKDIFSVVVEMTAFAMIDMTVITAVFKPIGRVQFTVLENGMPDVEYGASALLAAVVLSVLIGYLDHLIMTSKT